MPKVSVIIPVYGVEQYIERCARSLFEQTLDDMEFIFVNDCTPDNSMLVLQNVLNEYPNREQQVRIINFEKNKGAAASRKAGVAMAKGEWIFFSDSDDTLPQHALAGLMDLAHKKGSPDIISGTFKNGPFVYKHQKVGDLSAVEYLQAVLLLETHVGPWAKLIKKRLFQDFVWNTTKDIIQNEDLLMLVGVLQDAKRVCVDNDLVCYNFISRPNSASTKIMPYEGWEKLFRELEKCLEVKDAGIQRAFAIYRLRALYSYLILRGCCLDAKQYPYVMRLLSDCEKGLELTKQDKKIVAIIRNVTFQKINYVFFCLKKKVMSPLNRIAYNLNKLLDE